MKVAVAYVLKKNEEYSGMQRLDASREFLDQY